MKTINKNTCHYPAGLDNPEKGNSHFTRYSGQARVGQNKKAFTLVELIIVISILAILATIAFTSFQNFTKDARDGNRVSTITNIQKGLELYTIKTGNYPTPEGEISTGTINDQPLTYKGVIGETIGKQININKTPLDPLTEKNYVYGVTANNKQYQIASVLEGDMAYQHLISTTYASTYYSKVSGNYKGFIIYSSGITNEQWIANIPSLIYNFTGTTNLLSTTGAYFIINKGKNLPYAPNPQTQINHKALEATIQEKTNKSEAKLINMKKSELETIAKTGTGTLPDGVTSTGELFSSFGVETKESLEVLITGASSQVVPSPTPQDEEEETPPEEPTDGLCGSAHGKTRANAPIESQRCTNGTPSTTTGFTWNCVGVNGGQTVSCTTTQLTQPTVSAANNITQTSIRWNWGGSPGRTRFEWSYDGNDWINKNTLTNHIENTGLICGNTYSDRQVRACDDIGECTSSTTLANATTLTCPVPSGLGNYDQDRHTCETQTVTVPGTTIQIASCNVGATSTDPTNEASYGHYFQWGNQFAFVNSSITTTSTKAITDTCAPNNCRNTTFITSSSNPYDWSSSQNNNLWGGDCANSATPDATCKTKKQGPCPDEFHLPTQSEWSAVITALSLGSTNPGNVLRDGPLNLPFAGYRGRSLGSMSDQGIYGRYWSSSPSGTHAYSLVFDSGNVVPSYGGSRAGGFSIRCFKN